MAQEKRGQREKLPTIAVVSGGIGFVLTAGLIGFIGREALRGPGAAETPKLAVEAGRVHRTPGGYVVEFQATNTSSRTAAAVEIEGILETAGAEPVTSVVSIDHLPGNSSHKGGMVLPSDPRAGQLQLRVTGYAEP